MSQPHVRIPKFRCFSIHRKIRCEISHPHTHPDFQSLRTHDTPGVTKYGWRIGPTANFYGYGIAVLTIFQIITGDAWEAIQVDLSVVEPSCTPLFNAQYVHGWHDSVG